MKKLLSVLLSLLMLMTAAGCAAQETSKFSAEDLYLTIQDADYHCKTNIETVIETLGSDYAYSEGKSCAYDGLDKTFTYKDAEFFTNPLNEGDMISEIYTASPQVTTSRDIAVGASKEDVLAAYGEPAKDTGMTLVYQVSSQAGEPSLCFDLQNDTVTAIYLTLEQV